MDNTEINILNDKDLEWLKVVDTYIQENIGDYKLTAQRIAVELNISRRQLYRKLLILRGVTPSEYIQTMRFAYVYEQLQKGRISTVKEAAHAIGIRKIRYFSEQFKKRFGELPSGFSN
jgi:AraC-like DNA-binding protein